jgi:hypothetical protein
LVDLSDELRLREAAPSDWPFVYSAWLESYATGSPLTINIFKSVFFHEHRKVINKVISRGDTQVTVIALEEDPAVLIGFVAWSDSVLHYAYVKGAFRRMGVMRAALSMLKIDPNLMECTHWTYVLSQLKPRWPKLIFNPYLLGE